MFGKIRDVITDLAKAPGDPSPTIMKIQYVEMRIVCKNFTHNLHSDMNDCESGAFHTEYMSSDMGSACLDQNILQVLT